MRDGAQTETAVLARRRSRRRWPDRLWPLPRRGLPARREARQDRAARPRRRPRPPRRDRRGAVRQLERQEELDRCDGQAVQRGRATASGARRSWSRPATAIRGTARPAQGGEDQARPLVAGRRVLAGAGVRALAGREAAGALRLLLAARGHPARDHDVGADGAGARVPGEAARLARHRQGGRHARRLGRLRAPGVGEVPLGPRPPRCQLRLPRGGLRGLRRARQDRRHHPRGPALAARHRVPEGLRGGGRALRPLEQLDRRPDARQGAGLPLRGGAVREHDHREQREARQQALQARRDLPPGGERLDPAPDRHPQGGVGDGGEARGGAAVPRLPARARGAGRGDAAWPAADPAGRPARQPLRRGARRAARGRRDEGVQGPRRDGPQADPRSLGGGQGAGDPRPGARSLQQHEGRPDGQRQARGDGVHQEHEAPRPADGRPLQPRDHGTRPALRRARVRREGDLPRGRRLRRGQHVAARRGAPELPQAPGAAARPAGAALQHPAALRRQGHEQPHEPERFPRRAALGRGLRRPQGLLHRLRAPRRTRTCSRRSPTGRTRGCSPARPRRSPRPTKS